MKRISSIALSLALSVNALAIGPMPAGFRNAMRLQEDREQQAREVVKQGMVILAPTLGSLLGDAILLGGFAAGSVLNSKRDKERGKDQRGADERNKEEFDRASEQKRKDDIGANASKNVNQMNKFLDKGNNRRKLKIKRIDKDDKSGNYGAMPHAHFEDDSALNADGTRHHNKKRPNVSKVATKWLEENGWTVPKEFRSFNGE